MAKEIVISENRAFEGVWIPKNLYITSKFSPRTKFLLIEIKSLSKNGACFASDKHFSEFIGVSERMIQKMLKELKEQGYLETEYEYEEDTRAIKRRYLILTDNFYAEFVNEGTEKKFSEGAEQKFNTGTEQKYGDKYNNKSSITKNKKNYSAAEPHRCSDDVLRRAWHIAKDEGVETKDCDTLVDTIQYYFDKYYSVFGKPHKPISDRSLETIVSNLICADDDLDYLLLENSYIDMIDRHFATKYGKEVDYSLQHFATVGIIEYQARNCGFLDGYRE